MQLGRLPKPFQTLVGSSSVAVGMAVARAPHVADLDQGVRLGG